MTMKIASRADARSADADTRYSHLIGALRKRGAAPPGMWSLLSEICEVVDRCGDADLFLAGSLADGTADELSDLDLELVCRSEAREEALRTLINEKLTSSARILSQFPATHIGMPNLIINFIEAAGRLLKVDIHYLRHQPQLGQDQRVHLVQAGSFSGERPRARSSGNSLPANALEDLYSKFSGWIWYTHTKIARGELWEATDSLDVMRTRAFLPLLLLARGLPQEGYRHVEIRLCEEDLASLGRSRPSDLEPAALSCALREMVSTFETLVQPAMERVGQDFRVADLSAIREFAGV